jgi:hypothetical protein
VEHTAAATGAGTGESTAARDRFLVVKGRFGLGHRMVLAAAGILYGRLTDRRVVIDWSDAAYSSGGVNAFPRFFDLSSGASVDELPAGNSVAPAVWRGQVRRSLIGLEKGLPGDGNDALEVYPRQVDKRAHAAFRNASSIDPTRLEYDEQVLVLWGKPRRVEDMRAALQGSVAAFPRGTTDEIMRGLLSQLAPRPVVRDRVDRFKGERFHGRVVGVHARSTDKQSRLPEMLERVDELVRRDRSLLVFAATDHADVKAELEDRYSAISTPHWYPAPGLHLHESPACPDRFENGVEALVDLYLLAECDHLVCDTSSLFAYAAAVLSSAPDGVIDLSPRRPRGRLRRLRARLRLDAKTAHPPATRW